MVKYMQMYEGPYKLLKSYKIFPLDKSQYHTKLLHQIHYI